MQRTGCFFCFYDRDPLKHEEDVLGLVIFMSSRRSPPLVARPKKFALGPPGHFVLFIFVILRNQRTWSQRQSPWQEVSGKVISALHLGQFPTNLGQFSTPTSMTSFSHSLTNSLSWHVGARRWSCLCTIVFFYNSMKTSQTLLTSQAVCFVFCLYSFIHLCDSDVGWEWVGGGVAFSRAARVRNHPTKGPSHLSLGSNHITSTSTFGT